MDSSNVNIIITSVVGSSTVVGVFILGRILSYAAEIKKDIKELMHITTTQDVKIADLIKDSSQYSERLNRHSNRIMDAEKRILVIEQKVK